MADRIGKIMSCDQIFENFPTSCINVNFLLNDSYELKKKINNMKRIGTFAQPSGINTLCYEDANTIVKQHHRRI